MRGRADSNEAFSRAMSKLDSTLERARRSSSFIGTNATATVMNDCWDYPMEDQEDNPLVYNEDCGDQLPTVEEVRTNHAATFRKNKLLGGNCWKIAFFVVVGGLIGLIIGISVGFHEGEEFKKLEGEANGPVRDIGPQAPSPTSLIVPPTTLDLTPPPTPFPTSYPMIPATTTSEPTAGSTENSSRLDKVKSWLVDKNYASQLEMDNVNGYHHQATQWIADEDEAQVSIDDEVKFVERYVMALLYFASHKNTDTYAWTKKYEFLTSSLSVCDWGQEQEGDYRSGVTCNDEGSIIKINLVSNELRGPLISEMGLLRNLEHVMLDHNALTGTLPEQLAELTALSYLALHYNELNGKLLPEIGALTKLEFLGLGDNGFSGEIPEEWKALTDLSTLALDDNMLTGVLEVLESMTKLVRAWIGSNQLEDSIDTFSWGNLQLLEELDLSSNKFYGSIPQSLIELPILQMLILGHNKLTGKLPSSYPDDSPLRYLALSGNTLSGSIHSSIGNLVHLRHLDFSDNALEGVLPVGMSSLINLEYLFLSHNGNFSAGGVPQFLQHLTHLHDVSLGSTNRVGEIPEEVFKKLTNIIMIDLSTNELEGTIPPELGTLENLKYLLLNRNDDLVGTVPVEVQNLPHLSVFMVDQTSVTGSLAVACDRDSKPHVQLLGANCNTEDQDDDLGLGLSRMECKCCAVCCDTVGTLGPPDDTSCHDNTFFGQEDPTWENSYQRKQYQFGGEVFAEFTLNFTAIMYDPNVP